MYQINMLAVLAAGVANWLIGALWYSPVLFAKKWVELSGLKQEDMKMSPWTVIIGLLTYVVTAYVLAHVLIAFKATTIANGLAGGFWMWLGFIATVTLTSVLYERKKFSLYLLNNGYNLIGMLVMGAILVLWK